MTIQAFQNFMKAADREIERKRALSLADTERLTDKEFIEYMHIRAAEYSAANKPFYDQQARQMQASAAKREIVTDDDFYLQGDYDQVDSRKRYEFGE